jgi:hypothetical protein
MAGYNSVDFVVAPRNPRHVRDPYWAEGSAGEPASVVAIKAMRRAE